MRSVIAGFLMVVGLLAGALAVIVFRGIAKEQLGGAIHEIEALILVLIAVAAFGFGGVILAVESWREAVEKQRKVQHAPTQQPAPSYGVAEATVTTARPEWERSKDLRPEVAARVRAPTEP